MSYLKFECKSYKGSKHKWWMVQKTTHKLVVKVMDILKMLTRQDVKMLILVAVDFCIVLSDIYNILVL